MNGYDKRPVVQIGDDALVCAIGWPAILERLNLAGSVCIECYPGAPVDDIVDAFTRAFPAVEVLDTRTLFRDAASIEAALAPILGDDPVFALLEPVGIDIFLDSVAVDRWRAGRQEGHPLLVIGPGAATVLPQRDLLVQVSMARWELQQRQRRGEIANLGLDNHHDRAAEKYRRAFFIDWRVGDRIKAAIASEADFVIEVNGPEPKMIDAATYAAALAHVVSRPFRVVPFFDAGPWGGQWMRAHFDLADGPPNYAWCFDCVPEENSLLLGFGDRIFELPALDLVYRQTVALLGSDITERFGPEFPIRFDMLDTMEGGNLSLQVHPKLDYARSAFNLPYTQDESYYLLDAGDDATVYLGLTDSADPVAFERSLRNAQAGGEAPDIGTFVNRLPAKKHDHFLIPAGTVHCSGRNAMVLEISATPYIFTFKLWDWGRLGLDGRPRPIHIDHGLANIDWSRRTAFTQDELVNRVELMEQGRDWRRERTGLHALEFIETERLWFGSTVELDSAGTVNVLNLVEGEAAVVESPQGAFEPFVVHYAETFIIPAALGAYRMRSLRRDNAPCAVIRAFVRSQEALH